MSLSRPLDHGRSRASALAVMVLMFLCAGYPAGAQNAAQRGALRSLHPQSAEPDGVSATTVPLLLPSGLAYDGSGNLYVASTNDHVVRKIDTLGIISTVAGTGQQGFSGDGGAASAARLDSPVGVAVDASGNLYFADAHNNCIREVASSTGIITTIAGTRVAGFSGDGGAALSASFNLPTALALDSSGTLYIADTNNNRIRKVTGTTITTAAGDGEQIFSGDGGLAIAAGLDSPNGVAIDGSGNLYIGDTHNQRLRLVTLATGVITTFAGTGAKTYNGDGGAPTSSTLARPRGVAIAPNGTIFIADTDNDRVRSISGGIMATVAGNGLQGFSGDTGPAATAVIDTPRAVAVTAQGTLVLADTDNQRVRAVDSGGRIDTIAGLAPKAAETLTLTLRGMERASYGTGSLLATFTGNIPTGAVTFYDVTGGTPVPIGPGIPFAADLATLNTGVLDAGTHSIVATYSGDENNAAISSPVFLLMIAPLAITATANPASIQYGQAVPTLSGTLNGVLAQDAGKVNVVYSTTAALLSPAGAYPISAELAGSAAGNYTVSLSAPEALVIAPAGSEIILSASNTAPLLGAPVTLTAKVSSLTSGTATGTVNFFNGIDRLSAAPAPVVNGMAVISTSSLPPGSLSILAVYSGDQNFTTSTSAALLENVTDCTFSLHFITSPTTGSQTQTVTPGVAAAYAFAVTPTLPTMTNAVTLSVSGLPPLASYTLTPSKLEVGSGATNVTLVVTTSASLAKLTNSAKGWPRLALGALLIPIVARRKRAKASRKVGRRGSLMLGVAGALGAGLLTGCCTAGGSAAPPHSYSIAITAVNGCTSTTQSVTLIIQ